EDDGHQLAAVYATTPQIDRVVMEKIQPPTLISAVALHDFVAAEPLLRANPALINADAPAGGVLHMMAKRGDLEAVRWLIEQGAAVNARWNHWNTSLTPLHLAAAYGKADVVRLLLAVGADRTVRDSFHNGDPVGWAEHFKQPEMVRLLKDSAPEPEPES